jgi:hypothetical protein
VTAMAAMAVSVNRLDRHPRTSIMPYSVTSFRDRSSSAVKWSAWLLSNEVKSRRVCCRDDPLQSIVHSLSFDQRDQAELHSIGGISCSRCVLREWMLKSCRRISSDEFPVCGF